MNAEPHTHKVQLKEWLPFPALFTRFYVEYGDQEVCWGSKAPWNNPYNMSVEERERRFTAAVKKVIAKHEAGTDKLHSRLDKERRLEELALKLAPHNETSGFHDFLERQ